MIAHTAAQFRLGRRRKDGSVERDHLLAASRAGQEVPELNVPPLPAGSEPLYQAFLDIRSSCAAGFSAPVVTQADVRGWCQLQRVTLLPWEVDTIFALDRAARTALEPDTPAPAH